MKKAFFIFIITGMFYSLINCKSKHHLFDPNESTSLFISFGTGGGFTGKSIKYFLTQNGDIYKDENLSLVKINSIPINQVKQFYDNYKKLGLDSIELNDPGNKYYFLESNIVGKSHVIKWGRNPLEDKNLETFYNILVALVNQPKN